MTDVRRTESKPREGRDIRSPDLHQLRERFMGFVFPEPMSGCWLWAGPGYEDKRYGRFKPLFCTNNKSILAHRASVELFRGPFPRKAFVCHHCDTPACVNPDHLYVGDHASNMADMARRKRSFASTQPERARKIAKRLGDSNTWTRGAKNPKAKLALKEAEEIRRSKLKTKVLAERYGVNRTTIQRIRRGAAWN